MNVGLLTTFMNVFRMKEVDETFQVSALNMGVFLRWTVEVNTASAQHFVAVL